MAKIGKENRQPTPAELSLLAQETRRQLAGVLTAEQLEEYLLRYSQTAEQMRDQLRGFARMRRSSGGFSVCAMGTTSNSLP